MYQVALEDPCEGAKEKKIFSEICLKKFLVKSITFKFKNGKVAYFGNVLILLHSNSKASLCFIHGTF